MHQNKLILIPFSIVVDLMGHLEEELRLQALDDLGLPAVLAIGGGARQSLLHRRRRSPALLAYRCSKVAESIFPH